MLKKSQFLDLNNFRKLAVISKGGLGVVIQIEEKDTHKIYAAKLPNNLNIDKLIISQEIKIMQMNHPSICKFIGFCPFDFENERRPVIITKFYTNRSLKQILELNRNSKSQQIWNNTKKLINIYGIASAMSFLHAHKISHRDLKPSNILEDDHLYPQISDFGLSQNFEFRHNFENSENQISEGTPLYMAPEILMGNGFTSKSDVYSFSMIAYEILTNKIPFEGQNMFDVLTKIIQQQFRPDVSGIPKYFQELITKCWSQEPNERPNFSEIVKMLKQNLDFVTEFEIDEDEYFNYVEFVDNFNGNENLNKNLKKVSLFDSFQYRPFLITDRIISLKKFEKLDRIGEGSCSVVYEIVYNENRKKFAAKIYKKEFFKDFENENDSINLKREVTILQKLDHPAIVKFVGYSPVSFDNSYNPVIVTELVSNRSLEEIINLERNGLAREFWNETKKLINIYGIASSMSYLHSLNILHRNLKPSNILVDELFHPKLADFGLSKEIDQNQDDLLRNDETPLLGAYVYIAPEVYSNLEYSKASDVYAFSLIVYEIVTNQKPFLGSTVYQIMINAVNCFRPNLNINLPSCYKKLIEACWSPDPKNRPSFDRILNFLKTEKSFLNEFVNQEEFFDYVEKIDRKQTTFNSLKTSFKVDFDSIYRKGNLLLEKEGFLNLTDYEAEKKNSKRKGEFSTTYNVIDKKIGSLFTAKESNIEMNKLSKRETDSLMDDVQLLSSLNHPSILKFIGYSSTDFKSINKPVIISELMPNTTLENIIDIERNGLEFEGWNDTKKLINIYGIASCMSYLHSSNILHRNLKPKNIFIDSFYHPKLTNFGYFNQNQMKKCMTIQSSFGPTDDPAYYAPEIFISGQFTKASDVYSFGFIVYEIITSEKPFQSFSNSLQIIKEVVNNLGRPQINSSIPICYKELIESCWKQNPSERPTFEQILNTLNNDPRFITPMVNKDEYHQFIEFITSKTMPPNLKNNEIENLLKNAEKNDPVSLFNLGLIYSKGQGVPVDKQKAAQFYKKAADLGNPQAQYNLGLMYLKGDHVTKDKQKAAELFESAASKGDAKAQFNLGIMYAKGEGVVQNYQKAAELYEKAADQDDPEAQVNLGLMFDQGEGVPVNKRKAFDLYLKSARKGNPIAQFNLGIMYHKGLEGIIEKDNKKAKQLYQKAADQGIAQAQFNLGVLYLNGDTDVPINKAKAMQLFEKAADQGYADAQLNLGLLYSKENKEKMVELFQKAANQNNPKALFNLGVLYAKGEIVEKDAKKAVEYYTKAAELNFQQAKFNLGVLYFRGADGIEQNKPKAAEFFEQISQTNPKAAFNLALMYMAGDGVPKDEKKALHLYERAASLNNADALFNLGCFYDEGSFGVEKDKRKAVHYYKKAADLGNAKAQLNLGLMYQKGIGCEVDKEKAKEYFKMASDQGNDQAQLSLALLLLELEKPEKTQALKLLKSSAKLGNPAAMFYLARRYQQNNDMKKAIDYFSRASRANYHYAKLELGKIYLKGENGIQKDLKKAEYFFKEAASHNVKEAQIYLADLHKNKPNDHPIKIIFDSLESKIMEIHKISKEPYQNANSALSDILDIFIYRNLSESLSMNARIRESLQNFNKEASILTKKSSLPSLKAGQTSTEIQKEKQNANEIQKLQIEVQGLETRLNQINKQIDLENYSPRSSPKQSKSAGSSFESRSTLSSASGIDSHQITNLIKKAEDGDAKAQLSLGAYFSTGKRVEKNYETALQFYLMAAEQGNMNAQYATGCFYYEGKGTIQNKEKAFQFFSLAAKQGHVKAQFALGHFYQYDSDQNQSNYKKAIEWYEKAAKQGHEGAIEILKNEKNLQ